MWDLVFFRMWASSYVTITGYLSVCHFTAQLTNCWAQKLHLPMAREQLKKGREIYLWHLNGPATAPRVVPPAHPPFDDQSGRGSWGRGEGGEWGVPQLPCTWIGHLNKRSSFKTHVRVVQSGISDCPIPFHSSIRSQSKWSSRRYPSSSAELPLPAIQSSILYMNVYIYIYFSIRWWAPRAKNILCLPRP